MEKKPTPELDPGTENPDICRDKIAQLEQKIRELEAFAAELQRFSDYSQLGEERVIINILERMFAARTLDQAYLDIGGFDPVVGSNTFKLYQMGWKGVIVEPNKEKLRNWNRVRPNDLLIPAAAVPDSWAMDKVTMVCSDQRDARESVDRALNARSRLGGTPSPVRYQADAIRFSKLLGKCKEANLAPSFMNIDIEGLEESLVLDFDFSGNSVPLICIEHFLNEFTDKLSLLEYRNSRLVQHLERSGYFLVSVCGISLVFCHRDFFVPYS